MICFFNEETLPDIFNEVTFIGTKIKATFNAYKNKYPFCCFWVQHKDNKPTALILKFEQMLFVEANAETDFDELRNFFAIIGYDSLQAEPFVFSKLGIIPSELYKVLVYKQAIEKSVKDLKEPSLKTAYEILYSEENPNIAKIDYMAWYADLSYRLRHNTAEVSVEQDASVAIASHVTESAAVISGVVTLPKQRKNRLGSNAIESLLGKLSVRKVFAAAEESVVPFYLANNFTFCGEVAVYNRGKGN